MALNWEIGLTHKFDIDEVNMRGKGCSGKAQFIDTRQDIKKVGIVKFTLLRASNSEQRYRTG